MTVRGLAFLLSIVFFIGVSGARAEMSSTNFKIPHSVLSAGGGYKDSTNFQSEDTLGQPAPLIEDELIPSSTNYINYPGFWYLIAGNPTCPGDFNSDKDVDGSDLADYLFDSGGLGLEVFAANFGKANCP
jgi:hypothetical protein